MALRLMLAAALGLTVFAIGAASAGADPVNAKRHLPITLTCGGSSFDTVSNGGGPWTPAHDLAGIGVFVPTLFGAQEGVFTDPEGNEEPFSDTELFPKGKAAPKGRTIVDCTFRIDTTFPDGSSLVVVGDVSGFWSG